MFPENPKLNHAPEKSKVRRIGPSNTEATRRRSSSASGLEFAGQVVLAVLGSLTPIDPNLGSPEPKT